ncbi:hypothetical protein RGQ29_003016 [Quercus rubra]|uniref:Uncharacterized protein n=1 Tax=Quercus rubra TaxID=3512 RepID=A0AAN7EBA0_QUERU|nr:hypothetical protein RGQ29_003016 [Quercus rubra]
MWQYVDHPPQHIGLSKEMVLGTLTCVNDDSNPSLYPPSKKTRLNFEEIWFHMKNNLDAKILLQELRSHIAREECGAAFKGQDHMSRSSRCTFLLLKGMQQTHGKWTLQLNHQMYFSAFFLAV